MKMYICLCNRISDKTIKTLVRDNRITSISGLKKCVSIGSHCGKCLPQATELIKTEQIKLAAVTEIETVQ
ncbi:(2Fe-2S)-binding protein [Arsenophonus apicola]|uniref:Bacterioferritin-associated ferredoxin n=1 Tax=Arsenophonus apicola TaxID=2879119 RepID=A0ABY8P1M7_9GAMM|nr:(2Fe-2S)-binding protein [Arsenophonus apicola]WGO83400.1 (2Fe-2S)-binding protein [Arsenophonus apicola]